MTALESVNRIRRTKLREDEVAAITSTDLITQAVLDALNTAADEHFGSRLWSFLRRYDGQAWFPAPFIETLGAGDFLQHATGGFLNNGLGTWSAPVLTDFTNRSPQAGSLRCKLLVTSDTALSATELIVTDLSATPFFPVTFSAPFRGADDSTATWTLFAHEIVLPANVRQVLSVANQEQPLDLTFVDRDVDIHGYFPRANLGFGEPQAAYVGGTITGTAQAGVSTQATGMGLAVWPPPDRSTVLTYSYVARPSRLTADSSEWTGVPSEHVTLIEEMAHATLLESNIEDDPKRAMQLRAQVIEPMRARLVASDRRSPLERRVTPTLGADANARIVPRYQIVLTT